jgi:hypothetical protein
LVTSSDAEASALATLEEEFGIPNSLDSDAAFLIDSGSLADCKLVFTPQGDEAETSKGEGNLELSCHKTVLAARSGFFRRLLQRRIGKESNYTTEDGLDVVQLDNDIIPAKYGYILLHAMYVSHSFRDNVLIKLVSEACGSSSHTSTSSSHNPFQLQRNHQTYNVTDSQTMLSNPSSLGSVISPNVGTRLVNTKI